MKKRILLVFMSVFLAAGTVAWAEKAEQKAVVVEDGRTVKVEYTLTVDGEKVDSSEGKEPIEFEAGAKQMISGFEKALIGMKAGEKKSFDVSPEDGYGTVNPQAFQEVPKDRLPQDVELEVGMVLGARSPDGRPMPVKISEIKKDTVVIDFNHPLAGKTLHFDVEVVEVK